MPPQRKASWNVEGKLSSCLDFIRWAAAVLVVVSHVKGLFFADYSQLERPGPALKWLYAVASAGHQAVMIFFVLSGMFISANVMKSIGKRDWSWGVYLTNRLTRLYIVLVPALFLGLLWDQAGIHWYGQTGVYDGLPEDRYVLGYSSAEHSSLKAFAGNLFYLQGIATGHFGSNGPLWSLSYEFWYYILFPCVILVLSSKGTAKKLLYAVLSAALCLWMGEQMLLYFLIWALGFLIHLMPPARFRYAKAVMWLMLPLSLASIFLYRLIPLNAFLADLCVAVMFAVLVYFMKSAYPAEKPNPRTASWSKFLAGFSYTTYLLHFPFLVFVHAVLYRIHPAKWQPGAATLGFGLALLAAALLYCWLVSFFTERRTDWIRRRILPLVARGSRRSPPLAKSTSNHAHSRRI